MRQITQWQVIITKYRIQSLLIDCTLSEGLKSCAIFESGAIYERAVQSLRVAGIQAKIHCKMPISSSRPEIYYFLINYNNSIIIYKAK